MEAPEEKRDPISACFNITELLEAILLNLDSKTILLSQRVNSKFRDVITSNNAFKQRLFLLPTSPQEIQEPNFRPNQATRPYIFVERIRTEDQLTEDERAEASRYLWYRKLRRERCTQRAILNPFMFHLPRWRLDEEWAVQLRLTKAFGLRALGPGQERHLPADSPLRRMYLAHPMPSVVRFRIPNRCEGYMSRTEISGWEGERPRTLGELMDEVERVASLDDGYGLGWSGVRVQLYGKRVPEIDWKAQRKEEKQGRKEARRAGKLEQQAVQRAKEREVDEEKWARKMMKRDRKAGRVEQPLPTNKRTKQPALMSDVLHLQEAEPEEHVWRLFELVKGSGWEPGVMW